MSNLNMRTAVLVERWVTTSTGRRKRVEAGRIEPSADVFERLGFVKVRSYSIRIPLHKKSGKSCRPTATLTPSAPSNRVTSAIGELCVRE